MHDLLQDVRYGLRTLAKQPGFTMTAVLVLGLGIGANTAIFSFINGMLFRPLAVEAPGELAHLYNQDTRRPDSFRGFSYPNYRDLRERTTVFADLMARDLTLVGLSEGETTRRVFAEIVSSNYFETLGVRLFRGRAFSPAEEAPGSAIPVAIVSNRHWSRAGSDPEMVGRAIRVNGQPFAVVGIAPRDFTGVTALAAPEIYLPLGVENTLVKNAFDQQERTLDDRDNHRLFVIGRLRAGIRPVEADPELKLAALQLERGFPSANQGYTIIARPLPRLSTNTSPTQETELSVVSVMLMAMAGVVLLIACLNLANMMLARGTARRKELAIRAALGGGRGRILRQLLTEGLLLSLVGGALGLLLAYWTTTLLGSSMNEVLARSSISMDVVLHAAPDLRVLLATLAFCVFSTLAFGLAPAWRLSRPDVLGDLKEGGGEGRGSGEGRGLVFRRNLLVVGQMALSLALLTVAGLFIRGAHNAAAADPGFGLVNGLLLEVDPGLAGYDEARGREAYRAILDRVRGLPGVQAVSVAATVPFGNVVLGKSVQRAGAEPAAPPAGGASATDTGVGAAFNAVGADYFATLGVPLLRGRAFTRAEAESESAPPVAMVDELLAGRLWPGEEAIGRAIRFAGRDGDGFPDQIEVVGVVPTLRDDFFSSQPRPHVYMPFAQAYQSGMNLHIRLSGDQGALASTLLRTIRAEIRALDEHIPILTLATAKDHMAGSVGLWLFQTGARMFTTFGALALLLAVVGIYGVKAYTVARRGREIGIRMALGATAGDALWLILREGLWLTLAGMGLGAALAALLARLLGSMLYQVSALDPLVFTAAPLLLASAAMLACYLPARRAATVDPMTALRYD